MGWSREEAIKMTEVATNREIGFVLGNGIELKVFEKIAEAVVNQYFKSEREE
jgi:hypothetical protein